MRFELIFARISQENGPYVNGVSGRIRTDDFNALQAFAFGHSATDTINWTGLAPDRTLLECSVYV